MSQEIKTTDQAFIALNAHAHLLEVGSAPETAAEIRRAVDVIRDGLEQLFTLTRERDEAHEAIAGYGAAVSAALESETLTLDVLQHMHLKGRVQLLVAERNRWRTDNARLRGALELASQAMEHMGEVLNGMDAVTEEDEAITAPAYEAVRAALAGEGEAKEENVAEDSYHLMAEMLDPHTRRQGGSLPTSVVESFQLLLEHWVARAALDGGGRRTRTCGAPRPWCVGLRRRWPGRGRLSHRTDAVAPAGTHPPPTRRRPVRREGTRPTARTGGRSTKTPPPRKRGRPSVSGVTDAYGTTLTKGKVSAGAEGRGAPRKRGGREPSLAMRLHPMQQGLQVEASQRQAHLETHPEREGPEPLQDLRA